MAPQADQYKAIIGHLPPAGPIDKEKRACCRMIIRAVREHWKAREMYLEFAFFSDNALKWLSPDAYLKAALKQFCSDMLVALEECPQFVAVMKRHAETMKQPYAYIHLGTQLHLYA